MPLEHQRESLLNTLAEAHNFEYLQLLLQHEDGDDKAKRDVIDGIREDLEDWFADASALVTDADGDANVTGQLVRMVPNLLDIVTRFAPTFVAAHGEGQGGGEDIESQWWWYKDEEKKHPSAHAAAVAAEFLFEVQFMGIHELLCDLLCTAVLDERHEESLARDSDPFIAIIGAEDFQLVSSIPVKELCSSTVLKYIAVYGFTQKCLDNHEFVHSMLASGFNGFADVSVEEGGAGPGLTPLYLLIDNSIHPPQRVHSWSCCVAVSAIMQVGADPNKAADGKETAMQFAARANGIIFGFLLSYQALQLGRDQGAGFGGVSGRVEESKEAATQADIASLRNEMREMRNQFGSILLLFGKILNVQPGMINAQPPSEAENRSSAAGSKSGAPHLRSPDRAQAPQNDQEQEREWERARVKRGPPLRPGAVPTMSPMANSLSSTSSLDSDEESLMRS